MPPARLTSIDALRLWSKFGSRPFQLVQLAFYLALSAAIVTLMHRRTMRVAILQ